MKVKSQIVNLSRVLYNIDLNDVEVNEAERAFVSYENKIEVEGSTAAVKAFYREGICILNCEFSSEINLVDQMEITGDHLKIIYLVKGENKVNINHVPNHHQTQTGSLIIGVDGDVYKEVEMCQPDDTEYIMIYMSREYFENLMNKEEWSKDSILNSLTMWSNYPTLFRRELPNDINIFQIINQIIKFDKREPQNKFLIDLKLRELFFFVHSSQLKIKNETKQQGNVCHDKKLDEVKSFLDANFMETPKLPELSKRFNLNVMQLKNGFKSKFGITIRSYIIQLKMERAVLLLEENHRVKEIAYLLGYQSVSHFITTFKNYHGITPKMWSGNETIG